MAKNKSSKKNGGTVLGFSLMGLISIATLVFVILTWMKMDDNNKDFKSFIISLMSVPPTSECEGFRNATRR